MQEIEGNLPSGKADCRFESVSDAVSLFPVFLDRLGASSVARFSVGGWQLLMAVHQRVFTCTVYYSGDLEAVVGDGLFSAEN